MALAVAVFCLLTLLALLPVGLNANRLSRQQIVAFDLCGMIESDLRATSTNTASPLYQIKMPTTPAAITSVLYDTYASSAVSFGAASTTSSQYRFTITLTPPATASPSDPVIANITVTWPPQLNPQMATEKISVCVAINRVGT